MTTIAQRAALAALVGACLGTACSPPPVECITGDEDVCDGGTLPEDLCNSAEEATSNPQCVLTLGTRLTERYISTTDGGVDRDWYSVQTGPLTPRSLLHVNAGYTAPQTAVNFALNVMKSDAVTNVTAGIDHHGAAAPRPVDLIVPFSESNSTLLLLVSDEGGVAVPRVDNRNPYSVLVEVLENPDTNEPNDTTPTPITLTPSGGISQGTISGYLATNDDVDQYSFQVTGSSRQIIYLHIKGAAPPQLNPPLPYALSYTLYDPSMTSIAEGQMDNNFLEVDLATAKLAPMPGTYTLVVQGYRTPSMTGPVKGDIRPESRYDVTVQVMPDLDTNEPNDLPSQARPVTMALDGTTNLTGKLSSIPDDEWWALTLPANNQPTVLRYSVSVSGSGGRFPPTSNLPQRQIRLLTEVSTGATLADKRTNCKTNSTVCPKGYGNDNTLKGLVDALCDLNDPPQCLWAEHDEEPNFGNLKNVQGAIPVPAHGSAVRYLLYFRDVGSARTKYADDRDYTIRVSWESDPTEAGASPQVISLSGSTSTAAGDISYGFGRLIDHDPNMGQGIRGPNDYNAYDTDVDSYRFNFPSSGDLAWNLEWDLIHPDAGSPPGDIAMEMTFCSNAACSTSTRRILSYKSGNLTPWYLPQSAGNATVLFTRNTSAGVTTIRAQPVGCWCFSSNYTPAGYFLIDVTGVDRDGNSRIRYAIRQSTGAYPQTYAGDGGTVSCPVSTDGGVNCGFPK